MTRYSLFVLKVPLNTNKPDQTTVNISVPFVLLLALYIVGRFIRRPWIGYRVTVLRRLRNYRDVIAGRSLFLLENSFKPSYCQISTDLDKILHTPIVVRNTLVGRFRPRSARWRLQTKPKRLRFL